MNPFARIMKLIKIYLADTADVAIKLWLQSISYG